MSFPLFYAIPNSTFDAIFENSLNGFSGIKPQCIIHNSKCILN